MERDIDRGSQGLVRGSSNESDSSHGKTKKKGSKKHHRTPYNFHKLYKGPKRFFPGIGYSYKIENVEDEEATKYLISVLKPKKKQAIRAELDKLFTVRGTILVVARKNFLAY